MNRKVKHTRRLSGFRRYSSEQRLLAVMLVVFYLVQPLQGTLTACFKNAVQIMDSPEYIMGHNYSHSDVDKTHSSEEHILLGEKGNDLGSKIWESLADPQTDGPYTLPEPNNQHKHTRFHKAFLLARWVDHKIDFTNISTHSPLVTLEIPGEPPQEA